VDGGRGRDRLSRTGGWGFGDDASEKTGVDPTGGKKGCLVRLSAKSKGRGKRLSAGRETQK